MKHYFLTLFICFNYNLNYAQNSTLLFAKLKKSYPDFVKDLQGNNLIFFDNTAIIFNDKKIKNKKELLINPDIKDMFLYDYVTFDICQKKDAGRIRNELFFRKMYGNSKIEVEKKLVDVIWCPKLVNQKIKITSVNGVNTQVEKLSAELDQHPDLKKYLVNIAGTFNWRKIAGTN